MLRSPDERSDIRGGIRSVPGFRCAHRGYAIVNARLLRVGKGALAPCLASCDAVGTLRFAHPTKSGYDFTISRRDAPGVLHFVCPPKVKRAQGRPGARCTRGLAGVLHRNMLPTSIQVQRRTSGLPHAMALRLIRDRPGDRLSCHHRPVEAFTSRKLDASTGASDPNDFTVRNSALVFRTIASTASLRTFVTIASAPLIAGDGRN